MNDKEIMNGAEEEEDVSPSKGDEIIMFRENKKRAPK